MSGSGDMSHSGVSGSQTIDMIGGVVQPKKKSEVKHVAFGGYGLAQIARMKEIIEDLA